jgi:hypothetical protein
LFAAWLPDTGKLLIIKFAAGVVIVPVVNVTAPVEPLSLVSETDVSCSCLPLISAIVYKVFLFKLFIC